MLKRCITRYDSLQFYIYLANTYSRDCWVTQTFINYETMPVVKIYIIFKYTILRSKQCWINRCITRYNILNLTLNLRGGGNHPSLVADVTINSLVYAEDWSSSPLIHPRFMTKEWYFSLQPSLLPLWPLHLCILSQRNGLYPRPLVIGI